MPLCVIFVPLWWGLDRCRSAPLVSILIVLITPAGAAKGREFVVLVEFFFQVHSQFQVPTESFSRRRRAPD